MVLFHETPTFKRCAKYMEFNLISLKINILQKFKNWKIMMIPSKYNWATLQAQYQAELMRFQCITVYFVLGVP